MMLVHGRLNHEGGHDLDSFETEVGRVVDEATKRVESGYTGMAVTDVLLGE